MKHVIIIGGGITGLAAAYAIEERQALESTGAAQPDEPPIQCTLLEASPRLGGSIQTEQVGGFVIEAGPDSFLSTKPWALDLCRRLGLTDRLVGTNRDQRAIFVYGGGRLHPLPEGLVLLAPARVGAFLRSSLLSPWGKARMALEVAVPRRQDGEDESLGAFVRRRFGREVLDKLVEPLFAGIYAGHPDQLSLRSVFSGFAELEQMHRSLILGVAATRRRAMPSASGWTTFVTFKGGMQELVQAITGRLSRVSVQTGTPVRTVRMIQPGADRAPRYEVRLAGGRILQADAVILTTPAYLAAEMVEDLDRLLAKQLWAIPYASTATVSLAYRRVGFRHSLNGFGFVVPRVEGRRILACTWTSTKFPHRAPPDHVLLRCFIGGAGGEVLAAQDDRAMLLMVREELRATMGIMNEPVLTRISRWPEANPQYLVGHGERLAAIDEALGRQPGLFLAGSAYRGVGIPDCIHQGSLAADRAWQFLQHPAPAVLHARVA